MTDWLSGAAMLLSGLVIGFLFLYNMRGKRNAAATTRDLERRDLEAKRDVLIEQLRTVGDDVDERARLEREAAQVLRQLALSPRERVARAERAPGEGRGATTTSPSHRDLKRATTTGFIWGVLSTASLFGIGWFVAQQAKPRSDANAPSTGAAMPQSTREQQPAQSDSVLQSLEEQVRAHPDDLQLRDQLAKAYFDRENLMAVFEQSKYVLDRKPDDAQALTYQALVRMSMGQNDAAATMFRKALDHDAGITEASIGLAWIYVQTKKSAEADAVIASAIKAHPDQQARLTDILGQMRARAASPTAPPLAEPSAKPAAADAIHVTVSLAPGAKASPTAVLFVLARAEGQTSGPPAAVKRIAAASFPLQLDLSSADSMMGQPLPAKVRIEARLDSDGNPLTRDAGDPSAMQDGVAAGAKVALQLH